MYHGLRGGVRGWHQGHSGKDSVWIHDRGAQRNPIVRLDRGRSRWLVPQGESTEHNRQRNDTNGSQNDGCRLGHDSPDR
jgi:hypothetical protein